MPGRGLQVAEPGHLHPARRAEMVEQRALAGGADAVDLVQLALPERLRAAGAVGGDGETVRLVAQPLQEIQHRVARRQLERLACRRCGTTRARRRGPGPWRWRPACTSSTPSSSSTACAAESWPAPPSISTRSGQDRGSRVPDPLLLQRAAEAARRAPRASWRSRRRGRSGRGCRICGRPPS